MPKYIAARPSVCGLFFYSVLNELCRLHDRKRHERQPDTDEIQTRLESHEAEYCVERCEQHERDESHGYQRGTVQRSVRKEAELKE